MDNIDTVKFWFKNSRPYTIPITTLCFLVVFVYSVCNGGNMITGLIAYIGVSIVHLATNLCDDYFDYKELIKTEEFCAKDCKCRYLRDGKATLKDLRNVIIIMLGTAAITGCILFITSGWYVLLFALCALPIAVFYSKFSSRGLGDIAVILAYGPLMFEGIYYVMCRKLSPEILILGFACAIIVNTVLYTHMLMDFDDDIAAKKITLCTRLNTKSKALKILMIFYLLAYILVIIFSVLTKNYYYFLVLLTFPFTVLLYKSLDLYNKNPEFLPKIHIWNYPLKPDNPKQINASFFYRFFFSINISVCFMILCCIAIILSSI